MYYTPNPQCVEENAHSAIDQSEYQKRYSNFVERYESSKSRLSQINEKRLDRVAKHEQITEFLKTLSKSESLLTEVDEELWNVTVETVTAHSAHDITFTFKDGTELPWKIK